MRWGARAAAVNSGRQHALKQSLDRCRLRRNAQAFRRGRGSIHTESAPLALSLKFVADHRQRRRRQQLYRALQLRGATGSRQWPATHRGLLQRWYYECSAYTIPDDLTVKNCAELLFGSEFIKFITGTAATAGITDKYNTGMGNEEYIQKIF